MNPSAAAFDRDREIIDWGHERGGREGLLCDISPEVVDPHWVSVSDERPVEVYGTVAPTGFQLGDTSLFAVANNQPVIISHTDYPGDHFGHDVNVLLVPDPEYQWLLGTANFFANEDRPDQRGNGRLEIEWEFLNPGVRLASINEEVRYEEGNVGVPAFVIPTVGDRVYVVGRWILDVGHSAVGSKTEIHPPRLMATMRKHHTAIPLFVSDDLPNVPTRASQVDIYVSGHGGAANQFLDGLSEPLDNGGLGGGRIKDALPPSRQGIYYKPGPISAKDAERVHDLQSDGKIIAGCFDVPTSIACNILDLDTSKLAAPAGPSGVGLDGRGPEFRPVNDMDYEFLVTLPPRPPEANGFFYQAVTHPQHTTQVNEIVELISPDPNTGLPRARIRLPYRDADNGIYARTLKFAWNTFSRPGNHLRVTMSSIVVSDEGEGGTSEGEWQMWTDIAGHWFYLTGVNPRAFLNTRRNDEIDSLEGATADIFLETEESLRVFTYGYEPPAATQNPPLVASPKSPTLS